MSITMPAPLMDLLMMNFLVPFVISITLNILNGNIEISGIPTKIISGNTYPIKVIIKNPDKKAKKTSFQSVALNREHSTGTYTNPTGRVKFTTYKNRTYVVSQLGLKLLSNITTFSFDWTAPSISDNSVISFYSNPVLADGDKTFANDAVKETATFGILGSSLKVVEVNSQDNYCINDSSEYAKIKITEPGILSIDSTTINNFFGNQKGSIRIWTSGGSTPYQYTCKYNNELYSGKQNNYNLKPGKYFLKIFDECQATLDTAFNIENNLYIHKTTLENNLILIPIPAYSIINLYSKYNKIKKYSIYDSSRRMVKENNLNLNKYTLDITSLKPGLYFIELEINNQKSFKRIIIL